ncbi:MAG: sugar transferase [Taibaiella sp.]|nr:sugar transferase [Taibaiella sp.]
MSRPKEVKSIIAQVAQGTVLVALCVLPFYRTIVTWSIGMALAAVLAYLIVAKNKFRVGIFSGLCILFFLVHLLGYWTSSNKNHAGFVIIQQLSFLIIPFILTQANVRKLNLQKLVVAWSLIMPVTGLYVLGSALLRYFYTHQVSVLFYHKLAAHMGISAIHLSLLYLVGLCVTLFGWRPRREIYKSLPGFIYVLLLFLLSSKIFIALMILALVVYCYQLMYHKKLLRWLLPAAVPGLCILVLMNIAPLKKRYLDIVQHPIQKAFAEKSDPAQYYDGYTFRLRQAFFARKMLLQNGSTLCLGVGTGDAQDELDEYILNSGMYTGKNGKNGYLGLNFHNQYLQTLVATGLIGFLVLLAILITQLYQAIVKRNKMMIMINLIFIISFFTESYFNTQTGIFSFLLFHSLLIYSGEAGGIELNKAWLKRGFDIGFALLLMLFVFSWLFPLIALVVWLDTRSNPFFCQLRVGQYQRLFWCIKFRTMLKNKEQDTLPAQLSDYRITRIGAVLRKYGLDELPQFVNVLLGQMSLIGPRPLMLSDEEQFRKWIPGFSQRLVVRPGISGLSQCRGYKGYVSSPRDVLIRYRLDMFYVKSCSMSLDLYIIRHTIVYLLLKQHFNPIKSRKQNVKD